MIQWEYASIEIGYMSAGVYKVVQTLDALGSHGWELVSVHENMGIFKRQKQVL